MARRVPRRAGPRRWAVFLAARWSRAPPLPRAVARLGWGAAPPSDTRRDFALATGPRGSWGTFGRVRVTPRRASGPRGVSEALPSRSAHRHAAAAARASRRQGFVDMSRRGSLTPRRPPTHRSSSSRCRAERAAACSGELEQPASVARALGCAGRTMWVMGYGVATSAPRCAGSTAAEGFAAPRRAAARNGAHVRERSPQQQRGRFSGRNGTSCGPHGRSFRQSA